MGSKSSFWNKLVGTVRTNVLKDDSADLTEREKLDMERMIRDRKVELIAQKRLRDLERKYAPKEDKPMKEVFNKIREYRQENISRREQRVQTTEDKKQRFKDIEMSRKGQAVRPITLNKVGDRCRELELERKQRVLMARSKYQK